MTWIGQTLLSRYRVVRPLDAGGMAAVYLAEDLQRPGWEMAVKHPLREADRKGTGMTDAELRDRFRTEIAKLIAMGEHRGIVRIEAQGEHEGTPFYVMPFLAGGSLEAALHAGPQGAETVVGWAREIADALDWIHARRPQVLHRDVKPSNILFDRHGQAYLADFGIVKELSVAWGTTAHNTGLGTRGYMAPEQVLEDGEIDERTDQYALAATMYRALSGTTPTYESTTGRTPLGKRTTDASRPGAARKRLKPLTAPDLAPHLPAAAAAAIERGLSKDQADRFATCRELVESFQAALTAGSGGTTRSVRPGGAGGTRGSAPTTSRGRPGPERDGGGEDAARLSAHGKTSRALLALLLLAGLGAGGYVYVWGLPGTTPRTPEPPALAHAPAPSKLPEPGPSAPPAPPALPDPKPPEPAPEPPKPAVPAAPPGPTPPGEVPAAAVELSIDAPLEGSRVEDGAVRVKGHVRGPAAGKVFVNGRGVEPVDGAFEVEIDPGALGEFEVYARIGAQDGSEVRAARRVTVVAAPLDVRLLEPKAGALVSTAALRVRGTVEGHGAGHVLVNGKELAVVAGAFSGTVPSGDDGPRTLEVEAPRRRGEPVKVSVAVEVDTTAPTLQTTLSATKDNVVAGTEANLEVTAVDAHPAAVLVDGEVHEVGKDGAASVRVTLQRGKKRVVSLVARDAGGLESAPLKVTLRPKGPLTLAVPQDHRTIQAAIDAAGEGDTVEIGAGTYGEALTVKKALRLVGSGRDAVRVDTGAVETPALTVETGAAVTVEGITFANDEGVRQAGPGFRTDGVTWDGSKWSLVVTQAPSGSTLASAGVAAQDTLTRVDDVAITDWYHLWQAYLSAAAKQPRFRLSYVFASGRRATESLACFPLVRVLGADFTLRRAALTTQGHVGLLISGAGSQATLDGVRVPSAVVGVAAVDGAHLAVSACQFTGMATAGVMASGTGVELDVSDSTFLDAGEAGEGMVIVGAGVGRITGNRAERCSYGLLACGPRCAVDTVRNHFSRNRENGMFYKWGCTGLIEGNTCEYNKKHGIDTCGLGTTPRITRNTCRFNDGYGVVW